MELDAGAVERSDSGGGERYAPAEFDAPKSVSPDQVAKLKQLEQAASIFYTCPDPERRDGAHRYLLEFRAEATSDIGMLPVLLYLIETSLSSDAIVFGCATLRELIQANWDKVQVAQIDYTRDVLIQTLFGFVSAARPNYVIVAVIRAISSLVKTSWRMSPRQHSIVALTSSLTDSPSSTRAHACAALQLLGDIVTDIQPDIGTFEHSQRSIAIMFKDQQLESILQLGLSALRSTLAPDMLPTKSFDPSVLALQESSLRLILTCLQYDFPAAGYSPVQSMHQPLLVPSEWKFLKEERTVNVFFSVAQRCPSPPRCEIQPLAMQCLSWLVTLKRSMFATVFERRDFLRIFVDGVTTLLKGPPNGVFLACEDNLVYLSRLIDSMRATFPFSDFVLLEAAFDEWLEAMHQFTIMLVRANLRCKVYLFETWASLVSASAKQSATLQSRGDPAAIQSRIQRLVQLSFTVVTTFVDVQLERQRAADPTSLNEDTEDDEGGPDISDGAAGVLASPLLKSVAIIVRSHGRCEFSSYVLTRMNEVLANSGDPHVFGQLRVLIDMVTCIVGNRTSWASIPALDEQADAKLNSLDAQLCAQSFAVMKQTDSLPPTCIPLELSYLAFLMEVHRCITSDGAAAESPTAVSLLRALVNVMPAPQDSIPVEDAEDAPFQRLLIMLLDLMVSKVSHNLSAWSTSTLSRAHVVIGASLSLLDSLAFGVRIRFSSGIGGARPSMSGASMAIPALCGIPKVYSNGRILLHSPFVRGLLHSAEADTGEHKWPFLSLPVFRKHRCAFYSTISRLFFLQEDHQIEQHWDAFISSVARAGAAIRAASPSAPASPGAVIGWLSDLRGVFRATNRPFTYHLALDWLFASHMATLAQLSVRHAHDLKLMYHIVRFLAELVDNSTKRMQFDRSDPMPIALFQQCAKVIGHFMSSHATPRIRSDVVPVVGQDDDDLADDDDDEDDEETRAPAGDVHKWARYRCALHSMVCLRRMLSGNWVNIGILGLYNDPSVQAVHATMTAALAIPYADLVQYPKLEDVVFPFLEAFCAQFPIAVMSFDDQRVGVVTQLFRHAMMKSSKAHLPACVLNAVAAVTSAMLSARFGGGHGHDVKVVEAHASARVDMYMHFLGLAVDYALHSVHCDKWNVSVPLFNLIVLYPRVAVAAIEAQLASHFGGGDVHHVQHQLYGVLAVVFASAAAAADSVVLSDRYCAIQVELQTSHQQGLEIVLAGEPFGADFNLSSSDYDSNSPSSSMDDTYRADVAEAPTAELCFQRIDEFIRQCSRSRGRALDGARIRFVDLFSQFYRRFRLSL
ncbi:Importin N-terminal domain-containing protein [Plasmodiophora brassicae]